MLRYSTLYYSLNSPNLSYFTIMPIFLALLSNPFVSRNNRQFLSTFEKILDKHAPIKRRKIRGNQKPFMNKPLRQAIMRRSKLLSIFQKTKLSADWEKYRIKAKELLS